MGRLNVAVRLDPVPLAGMWGRPGIRFVQAQLTRCNATSLLVSNQDPGLGSFGGLGCHSSIESSFLTVRYRLQVTLVEAPVHLTLEAAHWALPTYPKHVASGRRVP
jgi:hypothetical protein